MRYALRNITSQWPISYRCNLVSCLLRKNRPEYLEIGMLTNKDDHTESARMRELIDYCNSEHVDGIGYTMNDLFMMVPPNRDYFRKAIEYGVKNISVTTSASNSYQRKWLGKNIAQTHSVITQSLRDFPFEKTKVYLTCVDTCPETNKRVPIRETAGHVASFALRDDVSIVTLSDSAGNMPWWRMYALLDALRENGVPAEKIGFQLRLSAIGDNRFDQDVYGFARMIWGMHTFGVSNIDIADPTVVRGILGRRNEYINSEDYLHKGLNYTSFKQYLQIVEKNAVTEEQRWEGFLL